MTAEGREKEPNIEPVVGIIMGSDSDEKIMMEASKVLQDLGIPHSMNIVSAHRTPDVMIDYAKTAKNRGLKVIIAGAGGSAHLPGMIASETNVPVIGVPVKSDKLGGLDALLSQVQMPPGVPLAVMPINGSKNAALFAAQVLANEDPQLYERLEAYRLKMHDEVVEKDQALQDNLGIARRFLMQASQPN